MFWIELYLVYQMASWFVCRLGLNLSSAERNVLSVFLALGIKSILLFVYIVLGLASFIDFPEIFTIVVFLSYFDSAGCGVSCRNLGHNIGGHRYCDDWPFIIIINRKTTIMR